MLRRVLFHFPGTRLGQRLVFLLMPTALLVLDVLWWHPRILENYHRDRPLSAVKLVAHQTEAVGVFHGHGFEVSVDDVANEDFPSDLRGSGAALVISDFFESRSKEWAEGALGRAVTLKLKRLSPGAAERVQEALKSPATVHGGDVIPVALNLTRSDRPLFPFDYLFVLVFEAGQSGSETNILAPALLRIARLCESRDVATLVFPCVGFKWEDPHSLQFEDLFEPLFKAVGDNDSLFDVRVIFYENWPTLILEEAVSSFNREWTDPSDNAAGKLPYFYNQNIRLALVTVILCLLISSLLVPLNLNTTS
jgi:hypothetical protein